MLHGSFQVSHPGEKKVKGFLYSSNPRVAFDPPEFYGIENKIYFQIDTSGLKTGGRKRKGVLPSVRTWGNIRFPTPYG